MVPEDVGALLREAVEAVKSAKPLGGRTHCEAVKALRELLSKCTFEQAFLCSFHIFFLVLCSNSSSTTTFTGNHDEFPLMSPPFLPPLLAQGLQAHASGPGHWSPHLLLLQSDRLHVRCSVRIHARQGDDLEGKKG
jgi:hypothetical protein